MMRRSSFRLIYWTALLLAFCVLCNGYVNAQAQEEPFAITHGPCAQSPGADEMTIVWHTNRPGASKVVFSQDGGPEQSAVSSKDGLVPNQSTHHSVRLTGLKPGTLYRYRVSTREFKEFTTPYKLVFGETAQSETAEFTTLDPAKAGFSFLMWNDIHDRISDMETMFHEASWANVDFVVFDGDILNDFRSSDQAFHFYDACVKQFAQKLPMTFVRGNHETRGPVARQIADYFPGRGGRYYWSFDHGPAHFVVLDSGEDKTDGDVEYFGLSDFDQYRKEQTEWLRTDLSSDAARKAKFRIVISHIPSAYGDVNDYCCQEIRRLWDPIINEANVQLWLSGHLHKFMDRQPHEGGDNVYRAVINPKDGVVRVDVASDALQVTVTQQGGNVLTSDRIPANAEK